MLQPEGLGPVSRHWTANRLRLHYLDWGNAGAPPLILLHGAADHARSWDRVAQALRHDWHVIAPDLRGHGDSDWSPDGAYLMAFYAYDLAELARQQGDVPVTLLGHSLGAAIALRHAALHPAGVARVVAIEGMGSSPKALAEQATIPPATLWQDWFARRRTLLTRERRRFDAIDAAEARLQARFPRFPPVLARHLTEYGLRRTEGGQYVWKFDPLVAQRTPGDAEEAALPDLWRRIACPALLVYGRESWASNPAEDGRAAHLPNARTISIADAGHWLHHEQHDHFMAEVRAFLAAAPGTTA